MSLNGIKFFYYFFISSVYANNFTKREEASKALKPLDSICLKCICMGTSNCDKKSDICERDVCGRYRLTEVYWMDGGSLTVNNEDKNSPTAYVNCCFDVECSEATIHNYMEKYRKDCTGEGMISCEDYARIHQLGPFGCESPRLNPYFFNRFVKCLNKMSLHYSGCPPTNSLMHIVKLKLFIQFITITWINYNLIS